MDVREIQRKDGGFTGVVQYGTAGFSTTGDEHLGFATTGSVRSVNILL
jgi:hypothetical protein